MKDKPVKAKKVLYRIKRVDDALSYFAEIFLESEEGIQRYGETVPCIGKAPIRDAISGFAKEHGIESVEELKG